MSGSIGILIADDHPGVLMAIADSIREYPGVEVVALANTVDEAAEAAATLRPDLALVDAWLQGGGAVAAAHRIKAASPQTVVIALTSDQESELVTMVRAAGGSGCCEKDRVILLLPEILERLRTA